MVEALNMNDHKGVAGTIRVVASPAALHAKDKRADHLGGPTKDYNE